jgi:hypothetical protein
MIGAQGTSRRYLRWQSIVSAVENPFCTGEQYVRSMDDPWKEKLPSTYRPKLISLILKHHWSIGEQKPLEPDAGTGTTIPRRRQSTDLREYPSIPCLHKLQQAQWLESNPTTTAETKVHPKAGNCIPSNHASGSE